MKKGKVIVLFALCFMLIGCGNSKTSETNSEEKPSSVSDQEDDTTKGDSIQVVEQYTFDNALKSGYIIRKTTNGTEIKNEIYNNNRLDEFVKQVKEKKADNITIVEYLNQNDSLSINKLTELKYDGQNIIANYYDVFTDRKHFKASEKRNFIDANVREVENGLIYSLANDKNEDIKLISFNKSEIKN